MLYEYVGISVILGFLSSEFLGLLTGGMVSAGYLAYYADSPLRVVSTFVAAVAACLLTRLLGRVTILYGRRRFMAVIMISLIGAWLLERFVFVFPMIPGDLRVVGYIIPGLLANDMLKQGIVKTAALACLCALLIRFAALAGVL